MLQRVQSLQKVPTIKEQIFQIHFCGLVIGLEFCLLCKYLNQNKTFVCVCASAFCHFCALVNAFSF